ncbi:hypothetical protein P7M79_25185, partial [Vibrio parahaemolyticus]|nr:hypothetical protein [Vibrio parahaemolyticus]
SKWKSNPYGRTKNAVIIIKFEFCKKSEVDNVEVIYKKWHNNYDLVLGRKYKASFYKKGWLLVEIGYEQRALLREECFEKVE